MLLALSSSFLAAPAAAQLGGYALSEPGTYSFGEALAAAGAYNLNEHGTPGGYTMAEQTTPGGYSLSNPGGYSFGAQIPTITLDELADHPVPQLPGQPRRLQEVSEVTVPASVPASSGSGDLELDIVPAELPASRSWESANRGNWEEWYAQHFNTHTDVAGAGAYGMSVAGDAGLGSYGYGGYGGYGGSYGSEGAYFDFRSNRAFLPEQAVNTALTAEPDSTMLPAGSLVHLPSSGSGAGARLSSQQLQMEPAVPSMAGVSRGRGLSLGITGGQEAASNSYNTGFTGQANLAALNLQQPEQQMGPARRLLANAADVLSVLARPLRLREAATAPRYFARRLHMARSS
jgi:hypothetical protein